MPARPCRVDRQPHVDCSLHRPEQLFRIAAVDRRERLVSECLDRCTTHESNVAAIVGPRDVLGLAWRRRAKPHALATTVAVVNSKERRPLSTQIHVNMTP